MKNGKWTIYPQTRFVCREDLYSAAYDAAANGDFDPNEYECQTVEELPFDTICQILEELGVYTFASDKADKSSLREQRRQEVMELQAEREP